MLKEIFEHNRIKKIIKLKKYEIDKGKLYRKHEQLIKGNSKKIMNFIKGLCLFFIIVYIFGIVFNLENPFDYADKVHSYISNTDNAFLIKIIFPLLLFILSFDNLFIEKRELAKLKRKRVRIKKGINKEKTSLKEINKEIELKNEDLERLKGDEILTLTSKIFNWWSLIIFFILVLANVLNSNIIKNVFEVKTDNYYEAIYLLDRLAFIIFFVAIATISILSILLIVIDKLIIVRKYSENPDIEIFGYLSETIFFLLNNEKNLLIDEAKKRILRTKLERISEYLDEYYLEKKQSVVFYQTFNPLDSLIDASYDLNEGELEIILENSFDLLMDFLNCNENDFKKKYNDWNMKSNKQIKKWEKYKKILEVIILLSVPFSLYSFHFLLNLRGNELTGALAVYISTIVVLTIILKLDRIAKRIGMVFDLISKNKFSN